MHVPSAIIAAVLMSAGMICFGFGKKRPGTVSLVVGFIMMIAAVNA